jgi:predicted nucleic acid-binding Zn ribbon protein
MASNRKKKCPVCGEEIPEDATMCPNCGADLELLEMEEDLDDEDLVPLESFLDSIGDAEDVDPEKLLEEMRNLIQIPVSTSESVDENKEQVEREENVSNHPEENEETVEDEVPAEGEEDEDGEEVVYLCPVCEQPVAPDDKVCPHCGAIFVETKEEMAEALEEQLDMAKKLIKEMRAKNIDVSDVTPFLKNANLAKRKGDIESALENAIECVLKAKEKLQTPSNSS